MRKIKIKFRKSNSQRFCQCFNEMLHKADASENIFSEFSVLGEFHMHGLTSGIHLTNHAMCTCGVHIGNVREHVDVRTSIG